MTRTLLLLGLILFTSTALATDPFAEITDEAGVRVYSNVAWGAGVAFIDCENDDDLDIYVVDGQGDPNVLFVNDGSGAFAESVLQPDLGDTLWGKAAVPADFDNDGDTDLVLTRYAVMQTNRLFRNDDGIFTDISNGSGVDFADKATGAAWADYNNDGLLDLYITVYDGSHNNRLLKNLGNGQFMDVAQSLGVQDGTGWGYQPAWFDYDNDGDPDLYVGNDDFFGGTGNVLYRNNGDGTFTDVSVES